MSRRALYGIAFGLVTLAAGGMEFWYAFDDSDATLLWTDYLIRLPWWVLVPAVLGFVVWLPIHLFLSKRKGSKPTT